MKQITISGHSDDLIEIDGDIREEFSVWLNDDEVVYLCVSDGTMLEIMYNDDGMWRMSQLVAGTAEYTKDEGTDPDTDYSDKVTLNGDIKWVSLAAQKAA